MGSELYASEISVVQSQVGPTQSNILKWVPLVPFQFQK
jgi:hypothetical protein